MKNQEAENIVEKTSEDNEISFSEEAVSFTQRLKEISNDLKEFGVDTNEPDLFNSDSRSINTEDLIGHQKDNEEDDLRNTCIFKKTKKLMVFEKINGSHHGIGCSKTLSGIA